MSHGCQRGSNRSVISASSEYPSSVTVLHLLAGSADRFIVQGDSEVLRLYSSYVNTFPQLLGTFYRLCRTSAEFTQFLKVRPQPPALLGLLCACVFAVCDYNPGQ